MPRSSSVSSVSATDSYRNGTGDSLSPVSSNQNGLMRNGASTNGVEARTSLAAAPDKPERKINAKEAISKHRNWFSNFEKSKSPGGPQAPESVDSARRTSVNKENKPCVVAAGRAVEAPGGGGAKSPLSPLHQGRGPGARPGDSIDAYMQNWRKGPGEPQGRTR